MLALGHNPLIDDRFCEMTVYAKHIFSRDYLVLRAYPFRDDAFTLGIPTLLILTLIFHLLFMIVVFDGS